VGGDLAVGPLGETVPKQRANHLRPLYARHGLLL